MKRIIVLGAGGIAKTIVDIIERAGGRQVVGFLDPSRDRGVSYYGYPVLGGDADLATVVASEGVEVAVMAIGNDWIRARVARAAMQAVPSLTFDPAVDPSAIIARGAIVGRGNLIFPLAFLDSDIRIGDFSLLNAGAMVGHNSVVGDFATIGPQSLVCGDVRIEDFASIGAGARVLPGLTIGTHALVGAGSIITRDVPPFAVVYGSPARVVRQRSPGES